MLAPVVVGILVAHAPATAQASATQQPPASPVQTTSERPWPPADRTNMLIAAGNYLERGTFFVSSFEIIPE